MSQPWSTWAKSQRFCQLFFPTFDTAHLRQKAGSSPKSGSSPFRTTAASVASRDSASPRRARSKTPPPNQPMWLDVEHWSNESCKGSCWCCGLTLPLNSLNKMKMRQSASNGSDGWANNHDIQEHMVSHTNKHMGQLYWPHWNVTGNDG